MRRNKKLPSDKNPKPERIPESILTILFFVFIFLTGGYSLKNYWDIRVSGGDRNT